MPALTQKELDKLQCATPDCTEDHGPLVLHSACHMRSPVWVEYDRATGVLHVYCSVCKKTVANIEAAPGGKLS